MSSDEDDHEYDQNEEEQAHQEEERERNRARQQRNEAPTGEKLLARAGLPSAFDRDQLPWDEDAVKPWDLPPMPFVPGGTGVITATTATPSFALTTPLDMGAASAADMLQLPPNLSEFPAEIRQEIIAQYYKSKTLLIQQVTSLLLLLL